jgi:hypothetical protein
MWNWNNNKLCDDDIFIAFCINAIITNDDTPPNFLRDPNVVPKMKQQKKKRINMLPSS